MNGAMAAFVLSQMLCQPSAIWRQHETWAALQQLCLTIWGTAHMSQALVGWGRVWRSGRWRWGRSVGAANYHDGRHDVMAGKLGLGMAWLNTTVNLAADATRRKAYARAVGRTHEQKH